VGSWLAVLVFLFSIYLVSKTTTTMHGPYHKRQLVFKQIKFLPQLSIILSITPIGWSVKVLCWIEIAILCKGLLHLIKGCILHYTMVFMDLYNSYVCGFT
jgi:hypothetical protein